MIQMIQHISIVNAFLFPLYEFKKVEWMKILTKNWKGILSKYLSSYFMASIKDSRLMNNTLVIVCSIFNSSRKSSQKENQTPIKEIKACTVVLLIEKKISYESHPVLHLSMSLPWVVGCSNCWRNGVTDVTCTHIAYFQIFLTSVINVIIAVPVESMVDFYAGFQSWSCYPMCFYCD